MEMERFFEFPHTHMDRRPRKRARLGWDIPDVPKICWNMCRLGMFDSGNAQVGLFCGPNVGTISSYAPSSGLSEHTTSSLFVKAVLECWDRERKEMVAIKIVRGIKKYREAAMIEIEVLQQLGQHDKGGNRCVQIRNWFDYRNHICIVFEKLGPSLYDFLRKNSYRSFPIDLVLMHDLRMIHTDLKPENILLVSPEYVKVPDYKSSSRSPSSYFKRVPKSSAIKVIDFGSTTYEREDQNYIVSTRHYRAPEVILGIYTYCNCCGKNVCFNFVFVCSHLTIDFAGAIHVIYGVSDVYWWSYAQYGEALFQTHENLEHLAMMERVLGPLPQHMLKRVDVIVVHMSSRPAEKYVRRGRLDWPEGATSRESIKAVMKLPRLQNLIMQHVDHSAGDLIQLLQGLLRYDPSERLTAKEALRHSFFTDLLKKGRKFPIVKVRREAGNLLTIRA
ncbi:Serine/threonine-protein kinase AFC2, partial [Mucuna pruriens]